MNNEKLLKILPDDFKKQIKNISIIPTVDASGELLLIHLVRDQHIRFKKAAQMIMEHNSNIGSVYTEFQKKYHHVAGEKGIKDNINGYDFLVTPMSPISDKKQVAFYRRIRDIAPKGKTRNAIIIGTHSGLIPLHISHLYNRLYCVDIQKHSSVEAKDNLRLNRVNNCLVINDNISNWMVDFENYKYTPPGRKHKIGLLVSDTAMLSVEDVNKMLAIEPETVIFINNDKIDKNLEKGFEQNGYSLDVDVNVCGYSIHKIKKVIVDETV